MGKLLLAKVALAEPRLPQGPEIRAALERIRAGAGPLELTRADDDSLVFRFEGQTAAVSLLAAAVPPEEVRRAAAAAWYWPSAAETLAGCTAQILVGVLPESGDRVASALRLTELAAAAADAAHADAVFLGGRRPGPSARRLGRLRPPDEPPGLAALSLDRFPPPRRGSTGPAPCTPPAWTPSTRRRSKSMAAAASPARWSPGSMTSCITCWSKGPYCTKATPSAAPAKRRSKSISAPPAATSPLAWCSSGCKPLLNFGFLILDFGFGS